MKRNDLYLTFTRHWFKVFFMRRIFTLGLLIWVAGTAIVRVVGQYLLPPGHTGQIVLLYLVSLVAMMWLIRGVALWQKIERSAWIRVAGWLALPTLLLDPFSCIFFTLLFPNMDPAAAGIFGGWMLISCCGAVLGGLLVQDAAPRDAATAHVSKGER